MNNKWDKLFLLSILVAVIQLLFINGIVFWGFFNPKIYPIFLLLLPKNIKPIYLLFIGFVYGGVIDSFSQTQGIGMATSVFICFIKPYLFRLLYSKREDDEIEIKTTIQGVPFILRYLFIGLICFHIFYFFAELGEIKNMFYIVSKSVLSAGLSVLLYGLFLLMFTTNSKKTKA
jgi:hypothetical protein